MQSNTYTIGYVEISDVRAQEIHEAVDDLSEEKREYTRMLLTTAWARTQQPNASPVAVFEALCGAVKTFVCDSPESF